MKILSSILPNPKCERSVMTARYEKEKAVGLV